MDGSSQAGVSVVGAAVARMGTEPLTFGLELEFTLIIHEDEIPRGLPADDWIGCWLVHRALTEEGVPMHEPGDSSSSFALDRWVNEYEIGRDIAGPLPAIRDNATRFGKWSVATDISVELTPGESDRLPDDSYSTFSVELKSRIFNILEDDFIGEITHVLDILHTKLNSGAHNSSIRLIINETTGLHIHVGHAGTPARFPVRTIKNLFQLVTAFERQIDGLHTADRVSGSNPYTTAYCQPPSCRFRDHTDIFRTVHPLLRDLRSGNPLTWCAAIEGVVNKLQDLFLLTLDCKSSAYNFKLTTPHIATWTDDYERARKWTVEFRQHRGTLDPDELFAWLGVVLALLRFSSTTPHPVLQELIAHRVADPTYTTTHLLHMLAVPREAIAFYAAAAARDAEALAAAEREERAANPHPVARVDRRAALAAAGADNATRLQDLLRLVRIQTLRAGAGRGGALVAEKLMARGYGNFAPEVQRVLCEALVPWRPWTVDATAGEAVVQDEEGNVRVESAAETERRHAQGRGMAEKPEAMALPVASRGGDDVALGFAQFAGIEGDSLV
ncbi:putative amidoligase enzyme-domain-containing protein [Macrophomina phaseolina]|uniref:Amidoligase enzyme-domain-containing protein n=1 Tax=Macrophomina phaseolina TaxID=35725 RepID=A0ABQ8GDB9_9PEZI|nr:putative amidoligase enzyme-domain-containing protein [Macrophomina phaseolina]